MRIFVIGQCTLQWGRMEFGNIGNYYIVEPFFRQLHRVFPDADIITTLQFSTEFCSREKVTCVPLSCYYAWNDEDLSIAKKEYEIALEYSKTGVMSDVTPYIGFVMTSDLIVDFSGDMCGKNADFLGPNRFLVGLLKDRVAQLLGKPTVMLASSPGPFNNDDTLGFVHEVCMNFKAIENREAISKDVMQSYGFDISNVSDYACPAFIFDAATIEETKTACPENFLYEKNRPIVGFFLCGWNMLQGPFNRTDWRDDEFECYVSLLSHMIEKFDVDVCFMSHSNGFVLPPQFQPIHGKDYLLEEIMFRLMSEAGYANHVHLLTGIYSPAVTKGIVRQFDMHISGRIHGAVSALSQSIPTLIIDYGHEPKAHKLRGFAKVADVEDCIATPGRPTNLIEKAEYIWNNKSAISDRLKKRNIEYIRPLIEKMFDDLQNIIDIKQEDSF